MLRTALGLLLLLGAGPAFADPDTVEGEQRALGLHDLSISGGTLHARAFAQLSGGSTDERSEGAVAAGGELQVTSDDCDLVRLGGLARLGYADGRRASAESWASGCLVFLPMVLEVGHHLEWDVRPSLLAPLGLRAGDNRRETAFFRWQPLRVPLRSFAGPAPESSWPSGDLIVFEVRPEITVLWSRHGSLAAQEAVEAMPFRYLRTHTAAWGERRDFTVDVFHATGEFIDSGAAIRAWLLRLENLEVGPVLLTAGAGIASASAGPFVTDVKREVDLTTPRLVLGVETGAPGIHGWLRATRDTALVVDGYATIDSRLATGLRVDLAHLRVGVDGSLADTRVYVPGAMRVSGITGGGSLSVARSLANHLDATLQLDVARSFYAAAIDPSAMQLAVPRWGAQAFASLQASLGR